MGVNYIVLQFYKKIDVLYSFSGNGGERYIDA